MPTPQIKAFAEKSDKSVEEVEKLWKKAKAISIKEGQEDGSDSFYAYTTGILKKMLSLEEELTINEPVLPKETIDHSTAVNGTKPYADIKSAMRDAHISVMESSIDYLLGGDGDLFEEEVETENEIRLILKELPEQAKTADFAKKIEQGFICTNSKFTADVRIRKTTPIRGNDVKIPKYTMTAKFRPLNQEAEMEISEEMYAEFWRIATKKQSKIRYEVMNWEIDQHSNGEIRAEYEYQNKNDVPSIPNNWVVIEDKSTRTY